MSFTRYYHSCVGRCNRPQSPAHRTGHHTANVVTGYFSPPSTLCPNQHLRNDLRLIGVFRASILLTVCDFSRLSPSAEIRLHGEASCTTTARKLLKQHRKYFHSSKRNDIDNRAAFPDNITPKERVRAQVRPPLTSLYTEHYSA